MKDRERLMQWWADYLDGRQAITQQGRTRMHIVGNERVRAFPWRHPPQRLSCRRLPVDNYSR